MEFHWQFKRALSANCFLELGIPISSWSGEVMLKLGQLFKFGVPEGPAGLHSDHTEPDKCLNYVDLIQTESIYSGCVFYVHYSCVFKACVLFSEHSITVFSHIVNMIYCPPYLHLGHSWPMPPEVPRWRRTTRVSWPRTAGDCWRCDPSCPPCAFCFASPSHKQPISSAAECGASGPPAASPGWAPCPAAAALGSAPGGWPWRQKGGTAGVRGAVECDSSEGCTFCNGLYPSVSSSSSSSFQQ